jgi:uncharacterized protein YkwD
MGSGMAKASAGAIMAVLAVLGAGSAAGQQSLRELALSLVNGAREEAELDPLSLDEALVGAAEFHAEDMANRNYYAHVSPEGDSVRDRFLAEGGNEWLRAAENIALCTGCPTPAGEERVRAFHEGWMESPEHRENILDPGLASFGFAMAVGENRTYGVQTFAGPGRPEGLGPGEAEERMAPDALTERALQAVNRAREEEGLDPLEVQPALNDAASRLTADGAVRDASGALEEALSATGAGEWRSVGLVSGECGGCGTVPTGADVDHFVQEWLGEERLAGTLLDPEAQAFGYALTAGGEGRKGAVALAGREG